MLYGIDPPYERGGNVSPPVTKISMESNLKSRHSIFSTQTKTCLELMQTPCHHYKAQNNEINKPTNNNSQFMGASACKF